MGAGQFYAGHKDPQPIVRPGLQGGMLPEQQIANQDNATAVMFLV